MVIRGYAWLYRYMLTVGYTCLQYRLHAWLYTVIDENIISTLKVLETSRGKFQTLHNYEFQNQ